MDAAGKSASARRWQEVLAALVMPDKEHGVIHLVKYIGLAALSAKAVEVWLVLAPGMQFLVMIESILRLDGEADYLSFIASEPMMVVAMLVNFGLLAAAISWFYWYPATARFFLLLPAAVFIVYGWLQRLFGPSYLRLEDTPYLSLVVFLACLLVVDPRSYWLGASRLLATTVCALNLLVFAKAVWALQSMIVSLKTWSQVSTVILIWLAVGLLLARTKLGWALVLALATAQLVVGAIAGWSMVYPLREPIIPTLIIILLLTPPVFRWYFPRKDAPAESEEPG